MIVTRPVVVLRFPHVEQAQPDHTKQDAGDKKDHNREHTPVSFVHELFDLLRIRASLRDIYPCTNYAINWQFKRLCGRYWRIGRLSRGRTLLLVPERRGLIELQGRVELNIAARRADLCQDWLWIGADRPRQHDVALWGYQTARPCLVVAFRTADHHLLLPGNLA
jgi:hypothetical protein